MADDFDFRRARRVLERIPREVNRELTRALKTSGEQFRGAMFDRFTGYSNPRSVEDRLQNRSGNAGLRGSFGYEVSGALGSGRPLSLLAFSAGRPARIHEFGGTIRAKRTRYLTIPTGDNLTPGGRVRYPSAPDVERQDPGITYFVRSPRTGNLLLFAKHKPGTDPQPGKKPPKPLLLFVLKREVYIPPRLGFRRTWNALAPQRAVAIHNAVRAAIRAASGA